VNLGSKTPHRKTLRRRFLLITLLCLSVSFLLLTLAGTTASREKGLRLGSTTYSIEFDRDHSQEELFDLQNYNGPTSSRRAFSLAVPFCRVTFHSEYEPGDELRARLPRDVPSLTKHLSSKNRFELKIAAELLAEKKSEAVPALPALFNAWAANRDLNLQREIETISFSAPTQSLDALIQALSLTNFHIRAYPAQLIGRLGTNALRAAPVLFAAFQTNYVAKAQFARAYFDITGECSAMIPALREILKDPRWNEQHVVLDLFRDVGPKAASAVPEVLNLLNSQSQSGLEDAALLALSRISEDKKMVLNFALAALSRTNESPNSYVVHTLANLGALGLPHLLPLFKSSEDHHSQAGHALIAMGPAAAPYLNDFRVELHSTDPRRVTLACEIIASLGTNAAPALPDLTALLQSKDSSIRAHAAAALITLGYIEKPVIETLTDEFAVEGRSPWRPSLTFVELLATNEHARTVAKNRLLQNPAAAKKFNDQIEAWLVAAETLRMGTFAFQLESPEIRDLLRSIAPKP
jgi:hypothetical protein